MVTVTARAYLISAGRTYHMEGQWRAPTYHILWLATADPSRVIG